MSLIFRRQSTVTSLTIAMVLVGSAIYGEDASKEASDFFQTRLAPLLKARCLSCHGEGEKIEGELDLRTAQSAMRGGASGEAIVPNKSDESLLYRVVRYDDELKMPPESEAHLRLSRDQIAWVRDWIDRGAVWPAELTMEKVAKPRVGDDPTNPGDNLPDYHQTPPDYQYQSGAILIPAATADEPILEVWSAAKASQYLDDGALAWARERKCLACHTTGAYLQLRPALAEYLGPPLEEVKKTLGVKRNPDELTPTGKKAGPAVANNRLHTALALAEYDRHLEKQLSPRTDLALRSLFDAQREDSTFPIIPLRWVPYILDYFHDATVAARAVGTAPGWLDKIKADGDQGTLDRVENLRKFVQEMTPPHDYDRVHLLWAELRWPGLIDEPTKSEIIELLFSMQRPDGGWSTRSFGKPEAWGDGNRAVKLRAENYGADLPSDGHMTGLAIVVLRESGIASNDARIQRGIVWLKSNQRASGRWWTRSLNTDFWQFSTYHGTAHALLALGMCGEIEKP